MTQKGCVSLHLCMCVSVCEGQCVCVCVMSFIMCGEGQLGAGVYQTILIE